jgi:hypothetical protein
VPFTTCHTLTTCCVLLVTRDGATVPPFKSYITQGKIRHLRFRIMTFYFLKLRAATGDILFFLTSLRRKIAEGALCVKVIVWNPELVFGYPDWYFSKFYSTSWQVPGCALLCLDICLSNALQIIIHQPWYSACRLWDDDNFVKRATKQKVRSLLLLQQKELKYNFTRQI